MMIDECLVVELRVEGGDCPLADATRAVDVAVDARPPQLRADGNVLLQFSAPADSDTPGESALATALDDDDRVRYLHVSRSDGRDNYRCLSKHPCVVTDLVGAGLLLDGLRYREGRATVTGAVVGFEVLQGVLATAGETVGMRLTRVYPLGSEDEDAVAAGWDLTPAQEQAVRTALAMGYFSLPREADAAAVADELGISKSAFLERLRRAERTLFGQLFDES